MTKTAIILQLDSVVKEFPAKERDASAGQLCVLNEVSLALRAGELVWLRGPSGTGKTTLLSIAGLLASPTRGTVRVRANSSSGVLGPDAARIRRQHVGFVFQKPIFLPSLNTVENVALPSVEPASAARATAADLLTRFGLESRLLLRPALLSGGEAQRAALARALVNDPALVLADEPTAGLDADSAEIVRAHLAELAAAGRTVLVASHDPAFATVATRATELRDGRLVEWSSATDAIRSAEESS